MLAISIVQDHTDELHVVAYGSVQAVPTHVLFRVLRQLEVRLWAERPILASLVQGRPPRTHGLCHREGSLVHAQRLEDAFGEHLAEPLTSDLFDDLTDPIDVLAVLPALTRIEQAYRAQRCHGTRDNARDVSFLAVAQEVLVEEVVAEACGM